MFRDFAQEDQTLIHVVVILFVFLFSASLEFLVKFHIRGQRKPGLVRLLTSCLCERRSLAHCTCIIVNFRHWIVFFTLKTFEINSAEQVIKF